MNQIEAALSELAVCVGIPEAVRDCFQKSGSCTFDTHLSTHLTTGTSAGPQAPSNLRATPHSSCVLLEWDPPQDLLECLIYVNGIMEGKVSTGAAFVDTSTVADCFDNVVCSCCV